MGRTDRRRFGIFTHTPTLREAPAFGFFIFIPLRRQELANKGPISCMLHAIWTLKDPKQNVSPTKRHAVVFISEIVKEGWKKKSFIQGCYWEYREWIDSQCRGWWQWNAQGRGGYYVPRDEERTPQPFKNHQKLQKRNFHSLRHKLSMTEPLLTE